MSVMYDPYKDATRRPGDPVTRRFLASTALIALGAALLLGTLIPTVAVVIFPPAISYPDGPFKVLKPEIVAGEPLPLRVTRCFRDPVFSYERHTVEITRNVVNVDTGQRVMLGEGTADVGNGCETVDVTVTYIPSFLSPGRYYLEGAAHATRALNPRAVKWSSEVFTIVPKTP